jgi:hypothetical protein
MLNAENGPFISYCGLHSSYTMADQPIVQLAFHGEWGGGSYHGPFTTTLVNAIDTSATSFQVSSANLMSPLNQTLGPPVVGTILQFSTGEPVQVTAVNGTNLTVTRNYMPRLIWPWDSPSNHQSSAHAAGEMLTAQCSDWNYGGGGTMYWKFLDDPHGANTNNGIIYEIGTGVGGHDDFSSTVQASEGWLFRSGTLASEIGQPKTATIPVSPYFVNSAGECDGSGCSQHVSYHTLGAQYYTDGLPWNGVGIDSGVTPVSGQLYKYPFPYNDGNWPGPLRDIHRKQMPTQATSGGHPLKDMSGPGSVISDQPGDSYKYCVAYNAGECQPNSAKGDMFANLPGALDKKGCYGSDNPNPGIRDLCITDLPAFGNAMVQIGFTANHEGLGILPGQFDPYDLGTIGAGYSRVVSEGLGGPKASSELFKTLPDGSWGMFQVYSLPYLMMVKMPPFTKDSVRRDIFVRAPLTLTPPAGVGVATAEVEFGYAEQGAANAFHCTSRNEACVVVSDTVDDTNPFTYEQSDTFAPVACASGCTITIPVAPSHVAYYHVKYLDANGNQVAEDFGVSAESTAASVNQ